MRVFRPCFNVTLLATPVPLTIYVLGNEWGLNEILYNLILVVLSLLCVALSVWMIGINQETKTKLLSIIIKKIRKNNGAKN